eukprot:m.592427 g.592427  ORF g.592427 m.592427 type:complete len:69 (+) comp22391_c0_seq3:839-1045(+)
MALERAGTTVSLTAHSTSVDTGAADGTTPLPASDNRRAHRKKHVMNPNGDCHAYLRRQLIFNAYSYYD